MIHICHICGKTLLRDKEGLLNKGNILCNDCYEDAVWMETPLTAEMVEDIEKVLERPEDYEDF